MRNSSGKVDKFHRTGRINLEGTRGSPSLVNLGKLKAMKEKKGRQSQMSGANRKRDFSLFFGEKP